MSIMITVSSLVPTTKGNNLLRFQVVEATPSPNDPDAISCKVADETGCINAHFTNFGKHIKVGFVYELAHFRCKVIDHHLQIELMKESKITRVKYDMSFKDLFNNLSETFYASKVDQSITQNKPINEEIQKEPTQKEMDKIQEKKVQSQAKKKQIENEKQNKQQVVETKPKKIDQRNSEQANRYEKPEKNKKDRSEKNTKEIKQKEQQQQQTYQKREESDLKKKKYVEKEKYEGKREQYQDKSNRVLLKDIHKYREKKVNLIVQVQIKTAIAFSKYTLIRACDSSGAAYIEFHNHSHLQNKAWYCLKNFKIFEHREYGYVASQQQYSTYDILDDYNEVPEHKIISYPKPQ